MGDLRGFAKSVRIRGEAVVENTSELVRRVALSIDQAVVMATPVKTGRARANWRVQAGSANTETLPAPSSPGDGAQRALQEGLDAAAGYAGGDGSSIHITNSLPYIQRLNDGSSDQAPAGFVETAISIGVQAVRTAKGLTDELQVEEGP